MEYFFRIYFHLSVDCKGNVLDRFLWSFVYETMDFVKISLLSKNSQNILF